MKKSLILILTAIAFLAVPVLASADYRRSGEDTHSSWSKGDHQQRNYRDSDQHRKNYDKRDTRKQDPRDIRYARQNKELKKELRQTQWQLKKIRQAAKHQAQRDYRHDRYGRPVIVQQPRYYTAAPVVIGVPRIVISFGW